MQCFQTEIQQKRVFRRLYGTQVTHQLGGGLGYIGHFAEGFRVGQSVIRLVRTGQAGEFVGMSLPVEVAAVYDCSSHTGGMTVHIFGCGMGDNVGSPFKRAAIDRGSEGVVHNQRNAVPVCNPGELLNVEHVDAWIGDGFPEQTFRIRPESLVYFLFRSVGIHERTFDSELLHGYSEQVESSAVYGGRADEMVARLTDIEDGVKVCCLAG